MGRNVRQLLTAKDLCEIISACASAKVSIFEMHDIRIVLLGFGREFDFVGLCLELELKLQEFL